MRGGRFKEEQIIWILREQKARGVDGDG